MSWTVLPRYDAALKGVLIAYLLFGLTNTRYSTTPVQKMIACAHNYFTNLWCRKAILTMFSSFSLPHFEEVAVWKITRIVYKKTVSKVSLDHRP